MGDNPGSSNAVFFTASDSAWVWNQRERNLSSDTKFEDANGDRENDENFIFSSSTDHEQDWQFLPNLLNILCY